MHRSSGLEFSFVDRVMRLLGSEGAIDSNLLPLGIRENDSAFNLVVGDFDHPRHVSVLLRQTINRVAADPRGIVLHDRFDYSY